MTFIDFLQSNPLYFLGLVLVCAVIYYFSYTLFAAGKSFSSALLACTTLFVFYSYTQSFSPQVKTVIVMPDTKNLRLAEDGQLSFCYRGMAYHWDKTIDGIISTNPRKKFGVHLKCLSIEDGLDLLRKNGATLTEIEAMQQAYQQK